MAFSPHLALLLAREQLALSPEEAEARRLAAHQREDARQHGIHIRHPSPQRRPSVRVRLGTALIAVGERLTAPEAACPDAA